MEDEQIRIKENYEKNLKAKDYLKAMNIAWTQEAPELFLFMQTFIRNAFRSGRFNGSKLLEISSGATVHNVAFASAYFPNITMSDFVVDNLENLKMWVGGKSDTHQMLDIPAKLEGYGNNLEDGRSLLESRIRKSIKRIVRCDLLTDPVLLEESSDPETSPPFDMIISCLCLEVAPKDFAGYCEILKRLNRLLRKGGGLLVCGFSQASNWKVGGHVFHHIKLEEKDVLNALAEAGFGIIDMKSQAGEDMSDINFSYDKLYCIAAEKL